MISKRAYRFVKGRWLPALRSGAYKQAKERLRKREEEGNGYCCLGVAIDLMMQDALMTGAVNDWEARDNISDGYWVTDENGNALNNSVLPTVVAEFLFGNGDDSNGPVIGGKNLATRNDQGEDFDMIADVIEYWLKGQEVEA